MNEPKIKDLTIGNRSWDFMLSALFLTISMFAGVMILIWAAVGQYEAFKAAQHEQLHGSVNSVSAKISELVNERSRVITAIARDNRQTLEEILEDTEDEERIARFERQLRAYFPGFFAFTVVDADGSRVPDDLGEHVGELCTSDIDRFLYQDKGLSEVIEGVPHYQPVLHPQPNAYHFDIMGLWGSDSDQNHILFMSFNSETLSGILRDYQMPGSHIYLVQTGGSDLIEVGVEGARHQLNRSPTLSDTDKGDLFVQTAVPGTRWKAVGFTQSGLLSGQIHKLSLQYGSISVVIVAFWVFSLFVLYRLNCQRELAFNQLRTLNCNLEEIVAERTDELTKLSTAVTQSPVEVLITNFDGNIEYVNPRFTEITGYLREEAIDTNIRTLKFGEVDEDLMLGIWNTISSGKGWSGELLSHDKNGSTYWLGFSVSPVRDAENRITHFIWIGEDITEKKAQEEQILYRAQYDDLTGLPNRALARDRLEHAIQFSSRSEDEVVLIFVDLDDFKKVNDTLGHEHGDLLLMESAQRLKTAVRESDTIARLGGDEFLIILPQMHELTHVEAIAQKIIAEFNTPFILDDSEFVITASLGIAVYPNDGRDAKQLMRAADKAMYQSKADGGNTFHFFAPALDEDAKEQLRKEQQLRNALQLKEFSVVYQAIVSLPSCHVVGCEALLRWQNPELGAVKPDHFIPIAEQTGLIIRIGEYVLETACREIAAWNAANRQHLFVTVNVSPRQFWESGFVKRVASIIDGTGLSPACLELEVTEGMIIRNRRHTEQIMHDLSKMGIKLTMDDFGTGYSSLYHLKKFPFDKLKIDQSFIQDLASENDDTKLVSATVALAHGLGLKVIAEGIEKDSQLHILIDETCDYGQGYLFSRPVPTKELHAACFMK